MTLKQIQVCNHSLQFCDKCKIHFCRDCQTKKHPHLNKKGFIDVEDYEKLEEKYARLNVKYQKRMTK